MCTSLVGTWHSSLYLTIAQKNLNRISHTSELHHEQIPYSPPPPCLHSITLLFGSVALTKSPKLRCSQCPRSATSAAVQNMLSTSSVSSGDDDNIALSMFDSAQAIMDSDSGEEAGKGHGGSAPRKRSNMERDFDGAVRRFTEDYIGVDGTPPRQSEVIVERRFRIPRRFVNNCVLQNVLVVEMRKKDLRSVIDTCIWVFDCVYKSLCRALEIQNHPFPSARHPGQGWKFMVALGRAEGLRWRQ